VFSICLSEKKLWVSASSSRRSANPNRYADYFYMLLCRSSNLAEEAHIQRALCSASLQHQGERPVAENATETELSYTTCIMDRGRNNGSYHEHSVVVVISRKPDVIDAFHSLNPMFLATMEDLSRRVEAKAIILDRDTATQG
jgi:hypothetical protein